MKCFFLFAITWAMVMSFSIENDEETGLQAQNQDEDELQDTSTFLESRDQFHFGNVAGNVGQQGTNTGNVAVGTQVNYGQGGHGSHGGKGMNALLRDCGAGAWKLVMKIDGTKSTFQYSSALWSNKQTYNLPGGGSWFDSQETKLSTYWSTPFSKICLGMKIGQQFRFIAINKQAISLYSLIADGRYRATSVGRNTWKKLIGSQASLQRNCNKEGFNCNHSFSKARIGILGNEQNNCATPDSRIGFGTGGSEGNGINTCGNYANGRWYPDNGGKNIKAMGYVLVK